MANTAGMPGGGFGEATGQFGGMNTGDLVRYYSNLSNSDPNFSSAGAELQKRIPTGGTWGTNINAYNAGGSQDNFQADQTANTNAMLTATDPYSVQWRANNPQWVSAAQAAVGGNAPAIPSATPNLGTVNPQGTATTNSATPNANPLTPQQMAANAGNPNVVQAQGGSMGLDSNMTGATSLPAGTFGSNDGYQFGQSGGPSGYLDPGYAFRLDQGMNLLQGSAAAKGNMLSGPTLKALTNYGQDAASQEYSNAYNRFNTDRSFNYNVDNNDRNFAAQQANADRDFNYNAQVGDRNFNFGTLQDLTNLGLQGAAGGANTNNLLATLLSQNALSAGQTGAAGTMGQSNTISNLISQLLGQYQNNQWMSAFQNRSTGAPATG